MNNFWQRAITGAIFVVVLVGAIVLGGLYAIITFGLIVLFGLLEFYGMFKNTEAKPQLILGTIIGVVVYLSITLSSYTFSNSSFLPVISFSLTLLAGLALCSIPLIAISELFRKEKRPFENIAITYFGILYISLPFLLLVTMLLDIEAFVLHPDLRYMTGYWPVLSIFILIWTNDTFAYITGRLIGKHKLFERISPKKTWEGFIGGVFFAILAGVLLAYFLDKSYAQYITYALVAGIVGTAGDLAESMLKRSVDVKDSGTILPGHGGILDRFDAVLFVVPVIYFLEKSIFA